MPGPATVNALRAARVPVTVTGTTRTLDLPDAAARAKAGAYFQQLPIGGQPFVTVAWDYGTTNPLPVGNIPIRFE